MKKENKKKMLITIGILICVIGALMIFFNINYSKTRTEFNAKVSELISQADHQKDLFQKEDISALPIPVQRYFKYCGYLGTPKMSYGKIYYQNVDFCFGKDKPTIKIDYTQYNFINGSNRIAYIDSSMYGIPFEGLDTFMDGAGSMRGVLAKLFTLFDQKGNVMDESSLVTFLSEILLFPNAAVQNYIKWETIDNLHAKATITCYGMSVSGVYTFDESGKMLSFETDDRSVVSTNGSSEKIKWSVVFNEYKEVNGIKKPTSFKAIWHYNDGDLVYFDGNGTITDYN